MAKITSTAASSFTVIIEAKEGYYFMVGEGYVMIERDGADFTDHGRTSQVITNVSLAEDIHAMIKREQDPADNLYIVKLVSPKV